MAQLIYGLAKFSNQKYGFGSRLKKFNKINFLNNIKDYFKHFECADRYKGSNKAVKFFNKKKIHFKIDKIPLDKKSKEIEAYFKRKIELYSDKIDLKKIDVLYLHENSLNIIKNKKILRVLKNLKKENLIKNFGVSIYSEKELKFSLQNKLFTYIQIPVNLADSYLFFKYQKKFKNKKIIGRSLVLQGTLLNSKFKTKFKGQILNYIKKIDIICLKHRFDREELIYRYIFSLNRLDYALIGSINYKNIKNIIKFKKKGPLNLKIMKELTNIAKHKKLWSDPRKWN